MFKKKTNKDLLVSIRHAYSSCCAHVSLAVVGGLLLAPKRLLTSRTTLVGELAFAGPVNKVTAMWLKHAAGLGTTRAGINKCCWRFGFLFSCSSWEELFEAHGTSSVFLVFSNSDLNKLWQRAAVQALSGLFQEISLTVQLRGVKIAELVIAIPRLV